MLQFVTSNNDILFVNPRLVTGVLATMTDGVMDEDTCEIHTVGVAQPWIVNDSAADAQLRIAVFLP